MRNRAFRRVLALFSEVMGAELWSLTSNWELRLETVAQSHSESPWKTKSERFLKLDKF